MIIITHYLPSYIMNFGSGSAGNISTTHGGTSSTKTCWTASGGCDVSGLTLIFWTGVTGVTVWCWGWGEGSDTVW